MDQRTRDAVDTILRNGKDQPGALLPILHAVQDHVGHVPSDALSVIGKALNLSRAEVHGVVTFYPHFRAKPAGRHVISVCQAEACQAMGAQALTAHAVATLGTAMHATRADGRFTLEPVYCLGNCACSPAMMVGDDLYGCVDAALFDAIVAELE